MTSCGLNGGPLKGRGTYGARIACNLWSAEGTGRYDGSNPAKRLKNHPYFTQDKKDGDAQARQYIANMRDGAVAGIKYFDFRNLTRVAVMVRGNADGSMEIATDPRFQERIGSIPIRAEGKEWKRFVDSVEIGNGTYPLYFRFTGQGKIDFLEFELI